MIKRVSSRKAVKLAVHRQVFQGKREDVFGILNCARINWLNPAAFYQCIPHDSIIHDDIDTFRHTVIIAVPFRPNQFDVRLDLCPAD